MFRITGVEYVPVCKICADLQLGRLILAQNEKLAIIVHDNPYNNGHLIITLKQHKTLQETTVSELAELFEAAKRCIRLLSEAYRPHGFNIDIVQEPHVALQIVPRWNGDASFVSVFHNVRVIAETPYHTLKHLKQLIEKHNIVLL